MRNMQLYIHIPFCVRKCAYCDFLSFPAQEFTNQICYAHNDYSITKRDVFRVYTEALIREIAYYGKQLPDVELSTIYIGGGTPNLLDMDLMEAIMAAVRKSFRVSADAEVTMECNPGVMAAVQESVTGSPTDQPIQAGQTAGQPGQVPGQAGQTAGQPGQVPGQAGQTAGQPGQVPGQAGQTAGQSGQIFVGQHAADQQAVGLLGQAASGRLNQASSQQSRDQRWKQQMELFRRYLACGINRLSIGLQSTHDGELEILGRIHTWEDFLETWQAAKEAGFTNINIDVMSGIPYQRPERFRQTLNTILRMRPEHISAYSLIIEEGTTFYQLYHEDEQRQSAGEKTKMLPTEASVCRMLNDTKAILEAHGYRRYEISNYALPGYECRHNLGYWERTEYLGVGLGASSLVGEVRYANTRDMEAYIEGTHEIYAKNSVPIQKMYLSDDQPSGIERTNLHMEAIKLSRHDRMAEFMYLGLRKTDGIARSDFRQNFGVSIDAVYPEQIHRLTQEGLMMQRGGRIFLTDRGLDVSNYAMAMFL